MKAKIIKGNSPAEIQEALNECTSDAYLPDRPEQCLLLNYQLKIQSHDEEHYTNI
jgi:hypothetical protein